jgi:hypothetical protein
MDCVTLFICYPMNHVTLVIQYPTFAVGINFYSFSLECVLIQPIFAALHILLEVLHLVPVQLSIGKHLEERFSYLNIFRSAHHI